MSFLLEYLKQFANETSLHGFNHLRARHTTCLERIFWSCAILAAAIGAIFLIWSSIYRFRQNPTVISIETGYREWIVPFFGFTMCYDSKVDSDKANQFIIEHWIKNDSLENNNKSIFDYYKRFINLVLNINYKNLHYFEEFIDDKKLSNVDMLFLANSVLRSVEYKSSPRMKHQDTLTERGICHAFNSHNSRYFAPSKVRLKRKENNRINCSLGIQCIAQLWDMPDDVQIYIHPNDELANVQITPIYAKHRFMLEYEYTFKQLVASLAVRQLSVKQRGCVYPEDGPAIRLPITTYNICRMRCRMTIAIHLCGCYPYFYSPLRQSFQRKHKQCNSKGLFCLSRHASTLIHLISGNKTEINCHCLPNCETTTYILMTSSSQKTYPPMEILRQVRWEIPRMNTKRYYRKILYTIEDLLVSFGGIAGLFLGCSIISIIEIIYYFTFRLFFLLVRKRLKYKKMHKRK